MRLKTHTGYLKYVVIHKFYVTLECWKRGLWWRGLTHDLSKLWPSEWFAYAENFYGDKEAHNDLKWRLFSEHGNVWEMIPYGLLPEDKFKEAWLRHYKRNDHHWNYWIDDNGNPRRMSHPARLEMIADWYAMGRARGNASPVEWYLATRDKIKLHNVTRDWVEDQLGVSGVEVNQ